MFKNKLKFPRKKLFISFLGMVLLLYLVILGLQIWQFSNTKNSLEIRQNAEFAIILGAGVWQDLPTPVFKARLKHGLELAQKFENLKIICTGGLGEWDTLTEAEVCRDYLTVNGLAKDRIFLEKEPSKTTYQNLLEAKKVMNNQVKALIVSDPLHLFRAVEMAKKLNIEAYPEPTPHSLYRSFQSQSSFLLREIWFWHVFILFGV
jgi:uncharacterized SAM-binding protein YcdF (DUF218 family)